MQLTNAIFLDEAIYRRILETSPVGIMVVDEAGVVLTTSSSARVLLGYEAEDLIGQSVDVVAPISQRCRDIVLCSGRTVGRNESSTVSDPETYARRKNGSRFPADIELHQVDSERGRRFLVYVADGTARRKTDLETMQRATVDRLALIGQLAGGIAHEIRTPLSVIRNDIYFLQSQADRLGPEANEAIQEINVSLGKAIRIVSELLDFAREPERQPISARVSTIIAAALANCDLPNGIVMKIDQLTKRLSVQADPEQVERILINLIRNAVQALNGHGSIEIKALEDRERVSLDIIDDGPGIAEADRDRVFDPLFTTKTNGIGFGLAISQRYAERNFGELVVIDVPSGGACFRLTLPRASLTVEQNHYE